LIAEGLLTFACVTGTGCNETLHAYYNDNPKVEEFINQEEDKISKALGHTIVAYLGPAVYAAYGGTSSIMLHKDIYAQVNNQQYTLLYRTYF